MLKDKKVTVNMPKIRSRCKSDSTTKQSVLPIQIHSAGRVSKLLYSYTQGGCQIQIRYSINNTGYNAIHSSFKDVRVGLVSKRLFSLQREGVEIGIVCRVNPKTGYISICSLINKQKNWNGGAHINPNCSTYLGVFVAERVLSKVFKNVRRMRPGNPGYDFICGKGFKIDVKCSCLKKDQRGWGFSIKRNQEAEYFLCLAFDNRNDLNPQHIWLILGSEVNHCQGIGISISTLDKWAEYELTDKLDDVVTCCDTLKDRS